MDSNNNKSITVVFFGVGAIGSEVARFALSRPWLNIVGAIDSDPAKIGRDLGPVLGLGAQLGVEVTGDPLELFERVKPDVVVLTTGSFLRTIYDQLEKTVLFGIDIVTSAEELIFPTLQSPELALKIDDLAKQKGVTIRPTGVNPGFIMDSLIVFLATASVEIEHISAKRVVDCSLRRKQLQIKVGAGLSVEDFNANLGRQFFGHVGLLESAALVADALNIIPDRITQSIKPVIADQAIQTEHVSIKPGHVSGMRQVARCLRDGSESVSLEVLFYIGAPEPKDHIVIRGVPNIDVTIKDGIAGDQATVAILINAIQPTLEAKPGLLTPLGKSIADIPWRCAVDVGY